jgi:hypothetical protein
MSVLLLDSIVDKHAIDIENGYLKMVKVRFILFPVLVAHTNDHHLTNSPFLR